MKKSVAGIAPAGERRKSAQAGSTWSGRRLDPDPAQDHPHGRARDLDPKAGQDGVEGVGEPSVAITPQDRELRRPS